MENILNQKQINLQLEYSFFLYIRKFKKGLWNVFSIFIYSLILPFYYLLKRKQIKEQNIFFKEYFSNIRKLYYKNCKSLHFDIKKINELYKEIPSFIFFGKLYENKNLLIKIDEYLNLKKEQEDELTESLTNAFKELKALEAGEKEFKPIEELFENWE
ncbi:MAG: hypothetical protein B6I24_00035 [Bacteroidetes bacterium 4572_128]|nr:MAG: hypothetical protein B6I24_00035 [Bacteroidetes bacterium 4572_128]